MWEKAREARALGNSDQQSQILLQIQPWIRRFDYSIFNSEHRIEITRLEKWNVLQRR